MAITTEELRGMAEGRHVFSHKDGLALAAEVLEWRKGQSYQYIGADGKAVAARDMEDELITARAKLEAADDLCAALKLILPVAKAHYRFNGIQDSAFVDQADAALAKARGET